MRIFRKGPGPYHLNVSMIGPKLGDKLLQLGCGNGGLLAALAAKVGLTGRACAVDDTAEGVQRGQRGAARAGVLVEIEQGDYIHLPHDNGTFDLVVVNSLIAFMRPERRVHCLQEARRVLRPGGRCLIVEQAPRGGLGALFSRRDLDPHYRASATGTAAETALKAEGFIAVRLLAEREGLGFTEGVRPQQT